MRWYERLTSLQRPLHILGTAGKGPVMFWRGGERAAAQTQQQRVKRGRALFLQGILYCGNTEALLDRAIVNVGHCFACGPGNLLMEGGAWQVS